MDYIARYKSPVGAITIASDGEALTGLWLDGQKFYAAGLSPERRETALPVFDRTKPWLDCYFGGERPDFTPELGLRGTAFRREVWELLLEIPYGETRTYGQLAQILAERVGLARMSAQAVGGAVGRNPIALIVPCHRVIGADGSLTGYAGGLERKRLLLAMEQGKTAPAFCAPG